MNYNPLKDKSFWVVTLDVAFTLMALIITRYYPPGIEITTAIIAGIQAIAGVLLKGFFTADAILVKSFLATNLPNRNLPTQFIIPNVKGAQPK